MEHMGLSSSIGQPPQLESAFAPGLPRGASHTKLTPWYEQLTRLAFQKAHCLAWLQDTLRVLGGSTCQSNGFPV